MTTGSSRLHSDTPSALPAGTRLGEFELLSLLGVGGFGIVYLAFDHALEREVAVKEYMPASLAGRTETMHVSLRSQSDAETFALGLKSFVNEARLLARFDHPSLLKVLRFWEANGTAYMAMPVMRGRTVKEVRTEMAMAPDEAWLRALLDPLLGAIEKLHSEGVYHRDIAPDNIQIEPDGHPVLLDFGAARRVIGDKSQTLTAILKPAYAPIEQYGEAGSVKQGPWTDLYALGATLHFLLLGRPPAPATARAIHDDASLLTTDTCLGCSENFLRTIDWMLAPRPVDRPQTVSALREVLDGRALPPLRRMADPVPVSQWDRTVMLPPATGKPPLPADDEQATMVLPRATEAPGSRVQARPAVSPAPGPVTMAMPPPPPDRPPEPLPEAPPLRAPPVASALAEAPAPAGTPKWLPLGIGAAVAAVAVAAFALWPRSAPVPAPDLAASAPAVVASAAPPSPPPAAAPVAESTVATVVVPDKAPPPAATPVVAEPVKPARPAGSDKPAGGKPAVASTATPAVPAAAVPHTTPAPVAEAPARPQPEPVAPPPPPVTAPVEPPKPVVAGPEARCAGKNTLSYFVCMERECLRSEFATHADCLKWRKDAKRD